MTRVLACLAIGASQQKYGVVQTVYKQEDGKDAQTEAKALLQTLEQTGSVTGCPGDSRAVHNKRKPYSQNRN